MPGHDLERLVIRRGGADEIDELRLLQPRHLDQQRRDTAEVEPRNGNNDDGDVSLASVLCWAGRCIFR